MSLCSSCGKEFPFPMRTKTFPYLEIFIGNDAIVSVRLCGVCNATFVNLVQYFSEPKDDEEMKMLEKFISLIETDEIKRERYRPFEWVNNLQESWTKKIRDERLSHQNFVPVVDVTQYNDDVYKIIKDHVKAKARPYRLLLCPS